MFPLGEIIQPGQELRDLLLRDLSEHFREVVNEHMGDVVVAGMQTAEEALEEIVRAHRVCVVAGVDQASLIGNVIRKFFILFNAHDRTGFLADGRGDHFHQTLRFAGTFETHDQLDHMSITLLLKVRVIPYA